MFVKYIYYIYISGHKWSMTHRMLKSHRSNIYIYIYICNHENNVPFRLSPQWLCGNSCTWAYHVRFTWCTWLHIYIYIYIYFFFLFFFLENTPYLEDPSFLLKKSPSLFWLFYKRKVWFQLCDITTRGC